MYANDALVLELLALLKAHHIRDIVISPGSRHYAFTRSLEFDKSFKLYSVVDERSAAFFALGLIQATGKPAAVICTSGSASLNYGSAVAEAYYQSLPLIVLTADRLPELLDQSEDQMLNQTEIYHGFIRFGGQLKRVKDSRDLWYCNRVVNEALLAATQGSRGPVHLNIPIESHTDVKFDRAHLPVVRKIHRHSIEELSDRPDPLPTRLSGKRIVFAYGQSPPPSAAEIELLENFLLQHDAVCIADHLSNLPSRIAAKRTMMLLRTPSTREAIAAADIVITAGGNSTHLDELKTLLRESDAEHWRIDPDGRINDPFRSLTDVFTMTISEFLRASTPAPRLSLPQHKYANRIRSIEAQLPMPDCDDFGETAAIGALMSRIPPGSALHISNSAPIRMAHLFPIDDVEVQCNRGVNGIDGCMSTAVGYAAASDRDTYLIIGDLTFFYDMNALGIRHISPSLRILVVNNGGGAVMHSPLPLDYSNRAGRHVSAEHTLTTEGWVTSLGLAYRSAVDSTSLANGMEWLVSDDEARPKVLEVHTDRLKDIQQLKDVYRSLSDSDLGMGFLRRLRKLAGRLLRRAGIR